MGCTTTPAISKTRHGNLEVRVEVVGLERGHKVYPEIFVDGKPYGHVSKHRPVLYLGEGEHEIEVHSPGFVSWQERIYIAADPNYQYLHVILKKVAEVPETAARPEPQPTPGAPPEAQEPPEEPGEAPAAEHTSAFPVRLTSDCCCG